MFTRRVTEGHIKKRMTLFSDHHFAYGLKPSGLRGLFTREKILFGECHDGDCWFEDESLERGQIPLGLVFPGGRIDAIYKPNPDGFATMEWVQAVDVQIRDSYYENEP